MPDKKIQQDAIEKNNEKEICEVHDTLNKSQDPMPATETQKKKDIKNKSQKETIKDRKEKDGKINENSDLEKEGGSKENSDLEKKGDSKENSDLEKEGDSKKNTVQKKFVKRLYTAQQKTEFYRVWQTEGPYVPVSVIARRHGIEPKTALSWVSKFRESSVKGVPLIIRDSQYSPNKKLKDEQAHFIKEIIEKRPGISCIDIVDALSSEFEGLSVGINTVYKHVRRNCGISLSQTKFPSKDNKFSSKA